VTRYRVEDAPTKPRYRELFECIAPARRTGWAWDKAGISYPVYEREPLLSRDEVRRATKVTRDRDWIMLLDEKKK
jgi:hypothetical protein